MGEALQRWIEATQPRRIAHFKADPAYGARVAVRPGLDLKTPTATAAE